MLTAGALIRPAIETVRPQTYTPPPPPAPRALPRPDGVSTFERSRPVPVALNSPPSRAVDPSRMPRIDQHSPSGAWAGFPGEQVCGPTSALMLGKYFHSPALDALKTDAEKIDHLWETYGQPGDNGTSPDEMRKMLGVLGLQFAKDQNGQESQPGLIDDGSGGYTVNSNWMSQQLLAGRPVLVQGNTGDTGHWLIVTDVKGSPPVYTVNNPYDATQETMTQEQMHDFLANADGGRLYAIEQQPGWIP